MVAEEQERPGAYPLALVAGVSAFTLLPPAYAQVAAAADSEQPETKAADVPEVEEIIVTGSRVIRNGNDSPSPVTVVRPTTF